MGVSVEDLGANRYQAQGCGQSATYTCVVRNYETTCVSNSSSSFESSSTAQAMRSTPSYSKGARAKRDDKNGAAELKLDVLLDKDSTLRFRATPETTGEVVQMKVTHDGDLTDCQLSWMVNGSKQDISDVHFKRGKYSTAKIDLTRAMMQDLGVTQQMAFKACNQRWSLTDSQLDEVHRFAAMYEEELAWGGPARKGAAGARVAPTGGWPDWTPEGSTPKATTLPKTLDGEALFELLAPSVVTIENRQGKNGGLGSGVAVSPTEILTNCHVIEGAKKIVVKQDKKEWSAKVSRSDPGSDRCVLSVPDGKFKPVPGVRSYDDLKVGEPLYTLGSPNGLELTLGSGILSGLREEDGRHWVQTTAPISPGSSGGGLFDARGNVVGITTLILLGRQKSNQSLNFAIPADSYWQP